MIEEDTKAERFSIHRLAHYCFDLAELFSTDRVMPVVIFLRGRAARHELAQGRSAPLSELPLSGL